MWTFLLSTNVMFNVKKNGEKKMRSNVFCKTNGQLNIVH